MIAGLGNPGKQYETTRHNIGFLTVDRLAKQSDCKLDRIKYKSLCRDSQLCGKRVLLMKPQTFMNNSGEAIVEAMQFYKVPIEKVLIIYDDTTLDIGKLRIRRKGTDGGHNGIKSILYLTGKDTFPRIKIGIGQKPHPDFDLADWVLSSFTKQELASLDSVLDNAVAAARLILSDRLDEAMNRFN